MLTPVRNLAILLRSTKWYTRIRIGALEPSRPNVERDEPAGARARPATPTQSARHATPVIGTERATASAYDPRLTRPRMLFLADNGLTGISTWGAEISAMHQLAVEVSAALVATVAALSAATAGRATGEATESAEITAARSLSVFLPAVHWLFIECCSTGHMSEANGIRQRVAVRHGIAARNRTLTADVALPGPTKRSQAAIAICGRVTGARPSPHR